MILSNTECRGIAVQSGCVSILLFIFFHYSSSTGTIVCRDDKQQNAHYSCLYAANALARIVISNNPTLVFKDESISQGTLIFLNL